MSDERDSGGCGCGGGIGIGSFVAVIMSAALNHSFWWGALHFCLGWVYVLYALILRSPEIIPALRRMFNV